MYLVGVVVISVYESQIVKYFFNVKFLKFFIINPNERDNKNLKKNKKWFNTKKLKIKKKFKKN
jgi:hypothetical protein